MLADDILSQIDLLPVKELLPHEETISLNLKKLKEAMLNIGHLVDPVIVDKKTKLVLDGNHRRKVLEIIECPLSACQMVDYDSDEIKVGTWYPSSKLDISKIITLKGVKVEEVDFEEGVAAINDLTSPFLFTQKLDGKTKSYLLNPGKYKLMEMIEEQNYIISALKGSFDLTYFSDDDLISTLSKGYSVFVRRSYTKAEIVKAAQSHYVFPPKSTRHSIPNRIIRLNMKLGWLHEEKAEAWAYLKHMLEKRVYEGNVRRYSEPVIVIY